MSPTPLLKAAIVAIAASCLVFGSNPALAASGGLDTGGAAGAPSTTNNPPWRILLPDERGPDGPLGLMWFPASEDDAKASSIRTSQKLAEQAKRCIDMVIVEPSNKLVREGFEISELGQGVVLVDRNNEVSARIVDNGTPIPVEQVERMVQTELDRLESGAKVGLDTANQKIKQNDVDGAAALLTPIWEQRCLFPDLGKKAAKALKKIGRPVKVSARDASASR